MQIFVTNNNEFTHVDKFDGVEYIWEPGQKLLIDEDAAAHMFGYGRSDKTENLIRIGWSNLFNDEGVVRLSKFIFTSGKMVEEVEESNTIPEEEIEEDKIEIKEPVKKSKVVKELL